MSGHPVPRLPMRRKAQEEEEDEEEEEERANGKNKEVVEAARGGARNGKLLEQTIPAAPGAADAAPEIGGQRAHKKLSEKTCKAML